MLQKDEARLIDQVIRTVLIALLSALLTAFYISKAEAEDDAAPSEIQQPDIKPGKR